MYQLEEINPQCLPLQFVKDYLRVDHDLDDIEISVYIKAAESYVRNFIKAKPNEELDSELLIPMLSLIAYFYENKSVNMKSTEKTSAIFNSILDLHRGEIL